MTQGYQLSAQFVDQLRRMLAWWRRQPQSGAGLPSNVAAPLPAPCHRYAKLKANLSASGSANAVEQVYNSSNSAWSNGNTTLTIYAPPWFGNSSATIAAANSVVAIFFNGHRWDALVPYPARARWVVCAPTNSVNSGDATFTGNVSTSWEGTPPGNSVTVRNMGFAIPSNSNCLCTAGDNATEYRLVTVTPSAQAFHTAWQFNATASQIQVKTRSALGWWNGSESAWTNAAETTDCA